MCDERKCATLYRVGAVSAILTTVITLTQIAVFAISPPPSFQPTSESAVAIFEMLRSNPLLGFVELDGLMLVDYVLIVIVFLALYVALRGAQPVLVLLGSVLALVAITAYLAVNPSLSMLALSRYYPSNGTVAAGQALLANFQGSGFIVHYLLMGFAGLLVSFAMLRSRVFSRTTAVAGLLQGAMMLVPSNLGTIGLVFALGSLAPFVVWFVLIAMRLRRLARECASSA
jgi:hypothetical protein